MMRLPARPVFTLLATLVVAFLFPVALWCQGLARDALANFSDDTQQMAYTNLAEIRSLAVYRQIRQQLLARQFRDFLDFLRSTGTDPDKDVDEVVLGWRGAPTDTGNFFGLTSGRFDPNLARQFFAQKNLPTRQYNGVDFYAFGSGQEVADFFFCFLSSSLAAFGHLNDLAAVVDTRSGERRALDSNSTVVAWEAELEGSAPQWGLLTGKAAANMAAPWLTNGAKLPVDPSTVLTPVQAVLYQVDWAAGFSARISILCQNTESASALAQLLTLWRDYQQATGSTSGAAPAVANLGVAANGSRVELTASGPFDALGQVLKLH